MVSTPGLIGLALLALSIPLLVVGRYMADVFNAFELITRKADALLESLYTAGLGTALGGYFLVLHAFSKLVAFSLVAGVLVAGYAVWALDKALDSEVIKRKEG